MSEANPSPPQPPDAEAERQRADAEARNAHLTRQLATLTAELADHKQRLDAAQRQGALQSCGAIDTQAVSALIDSMVTSTAAADFTAALASLRAAKPHLFRRQGAFMPAATQPGDSAAASALPRGDRRSLLDYLRAKRA